MKNSRKIVVGSALILALSFSTIEDSISYAEEDSPVNVESNEIETNEENNENLLETPNEELKEDGDLENTEEDKDIDPSTEVSELKLDEANDKIYTESDYAENYSRVDENQYKYRDQSDDDNIIFEEERYNEAKDYEKSEEYQKENPYDKIQNIKEIEENKRIEKFDENLDIGFGDGVIAKNSAGLLNDFVKFNYKNDKAYFDDINHRRFEVSFDDEDFDPAKAGDYEIKARVMSYYWHISNGRDLEIGDIVENFIRVKVVDDGNERPMYDSASEAKDAAKKAIESSSNFNEYTISKEGNKYIYDLSYYDNSGDYKRPDGALDREYTAYKNIVESDEELKDFFKDDMHKYDEESQKYIKSLLYNSGQITENLSKEEFEEKYPDGSPFIEGDMFRKNFINRVLDKIKLLPQYDYKNKSINEKISIEDFVVLTTYNADLEVGNKLPRINKLLDFNNLKFNSGVNYSWDPDSIDTNKLGKQNLDVKFTYRNSKGEEEEFTKTLVINIVDSSKQDPDTEQTLDKKGLEKEISEENSIDPKDFTKESYQNYKALLAAAKNILNKKDTKQAEIDKALENLKESRKNLVKVNSNKEDQNNKNTDNKNNASKNDDNQNNSGKNDDNQNNSGKNNDSKKEDSNSDFPSFATESEARDAAEEYLLNSKDFDSYTINKTEDGKYYYELARKNKNAGESKDDKEALKVNKETRGQELEIKPVKVSEIKKSSNVETGVTGLAGVLGVFATAVGGYFFTKKNK